MLYLCAKGSVMSLQPWEKGDRPAEGGGVRGVSLMHGAWTGTAQVLGAFVSISVFCSGSGSGSGSGSIRAAVFTGGYSLLPYFDQKLLIYVI
jgi:hypothetical protein